MSLRAIEIASLEMGQLGTLMPSVKSKIVYM